MTSNWSRQGLWALLLAAIVALASACGSNAPQGRESFSGRNRSALDAGRAEASSDDDLSEPKTVKKKKAEVDDEDDEEGEDDEELSGEEDADEDEADEDEANATPKVPIRKILIIGDSYFARLRGNGGISDHIRNRSNYTVVDKAVSGARIDDINRQYDNHGGGEYDAVIFNGGGNDFLAGCILIAGNCSKPQTSVLQKIESLAQKIKADGIPYAIYLGYHDMVLLKAAADPTLAAIKDELAPKHGFHFVDIRPTFAGKHATYIEGDQIHPTKEGSAVIADLLIQKMEELQK